MAPIALGGAGVETRPSVQAAGGSWGSQDVGVFVIALLFIFLDWL
jgi:hypothetical protein